MIVEISIKNFKSIKDAKVVFSNINTIVGLNGAGKTNLLKGINLLKRVALGTTLDDALRDVILVPPELFFSHDVSQEVSFSLKVKDKDKCFIFNLTIGYEDRLQKNANIFSELSIKQESLFECEYDKGTVSKVVYKREKNNIVKNDEGSNIPIEVASNQSIAGIYKHPQITLFRKILSNIRMVQADSTAVLSRQTRFARYEDLSNITSLIVRLKHEDEEKFKLFESTLKKLVPSLQNITDFASPDNSGNENLYLVLFEQFNLSGKLSFKSLSDGDLKTLIMILYSFLLKDDSTLIIEEIENALHPHRVHEIREYLTRASYMHNMQIIITTHSPLIIDQVNPQEVIYVHRKDNEASQFIHLKEAKYLTKIQSVLKEGGNLTDFIESVIT